jgi:8-oxo-dGTP pyrophosphatase MutT (NUDIX family)
VTEPVASDTAGEAADPAAGDAVAPAVGDLQAIARLALGELRSASPIAIDDEVRSRYVRLLAHDPSALLRTGGVGGGSGSGEEPGVHLTASAFLLDAPAEHTALVWHHKGDCWVQPGGHLERADAGLLDAVLREVAEETGLTGCTMAGPGPALLVPHDASTVFGSCRGHLDVVFVLRAPGPARDLSLTPESPTGATRWVPWPRTSREGFSPAPDLPGTMRAADDLPDLTAALAPYLDRYARHAT